MCLYLFIDLLYSLFVSNQTIALEEEFVGFRLDNCITCRSIICWFQAKQEHEFERGMKMECVNYENPNQICTATITKIVDPLMWVHLDSSVKGVASHIEHIDSHNLYPVGWCASNVYQLKPPKKTKSRGRPPKRVAIVQPG